MMAKKPRYTELTRDKPPVCRKIGRLLVKVETDGISVKAIRRRKWAKVPWDRLAKLALECSPIDPRGYTAKQWEAPLKALGVNR